MGPHPQSVGILQDFIIGWGFLMAPPTVGWESSGLQVRAGPSAISTNGCQPYSDCHALTWDPLLDFGIIFPYDPVSSPLTRQERECLQHPPLLCKVHHEMTHVVADLGFQ